jgi:adenosylcobinamide-phosphate synthase
VNKLTELLVIGLQILAALLLDRVLGEFPKWHPLVGFGNLANRLESTYNYSAKILANKNVANQNQTIIASIIRLRGAACCLALVTPLPLIIFLLASPSLIYLILETLILYLALGQKSLAQHSMQIFNPLSAGDLLQARKFTGYMVSRDTTQLTEQEMSRATVESVLENGHDAVIASVFYFVIGGAPLVILHRLVNTLDAMWGYKNTRFNHFGWFAAKFDDLLGFFSAVCSSVLYLLNRKKLHSLLTGLHLAWQQSEEYKSKNGGLCMSAGAQVLGVSLGGVANYHGTKTTSAKLGGGRQVVTADIPKSLKLVNQSGYTFVAIVLFIGFVIQIT